MKIKFWKNLIGSLYFYSTELIEGYLYVSTEILEQVSARRGKIVHLKGVLESRVHFSCGHLSPAITYRHVYPGLSYSGSRHNGNNFRLSHEIATCAKLPD